MRVLVFGATGGTGLELVRQSLDAGHEVCAFVHRNAEPLAELASRAKCLTGDVRNHASTTEAVAGQDAVLVALGVTRHSGKDVLTVGSKNILRAMRERGIRRLIVETGAGLAEDKSAVPLAWRMASALPPMRGMFKAKREQEELVRWSGLDWVIVRPANLTNGPLTDDYQVGENLKLRMGSTVSRADVAHFMIRQLTDDTWQHRAVTITGT